MASPPVELVLGVYLGLLTGIVPALVAWSLGFLFKYVTGVTIPGFGVVVLGVAIAGLNGGLLALVDPRVMESGGRALVALIVVLMMTLYAHSRGDRLGATLPKRVTLKSLKERALPREVVERIGGFGEVRIEVAGEVGDVEGFPSLTEEVREAVKGGEWRFPSDVPVSDLERRLEERLRTELDLSAVSVSIDSSGRASVRAAPPLSGVSRRVGPGERGVSVETVVPTGLGRGDRVSVRTGDRDIQGTVVSLRSRSREEGEGGVRVSRPVAVGGEGRVTVAVDREAVEPILLAGSPSLVVESQGVRREFELVSLLRGAGKRVGRVTVRADGVLDGASLGEVRVREEFGVVVLAVGRRDTWVMAPRGDTVVEQGDEVFVAGSRRELERFREAVA